MQQKYKFSLDGYIELISSLSDLGYAFRSFENFNRSEAHVILRHDVDMSLSDAAKLAQLEADNGISSTYFIMVSSDAYNVFSSSSKDVIRKLHEMGHNIGLHFDFSAYGVTYDEMDTSIELEASILEGIIGACVNIVSFHRPINWLLQNDKQFGGRDHTYQKKFFSEIGYVSDSAGRWAYGYPLEHESVKSRSAVQLLTHPIWWVNQNHCEPIEALQHLINQKNEDLERYLFLNCKSFKKIK